MTLTQSCNTPRSLQSQIALLHNTHQYISGTTASLQQSSGQCAQFVTQISSFAISVLKLICCKKKILLESCLIAQSHILQAIWTLHFIPMNYVSKVADRNNTHISDTYKEQILKKTECQNIKQKHSELLTAKRSMNVKPCNVLYFISMELKI